MHMADALISPLVGGAMWGVSTGTIGYSVKKLQHEIDHKKIPLMGVMGAFVFAAQMINFSIPLTGSSGHIGGGILLAILLGPYAGVVTLTSVLIIQALFFADGGLLALGSNIFNLGFFTCFVAYPLIYKRILKNGYSRRKIMVASLIASVVGLQLGALGVVFETILSGRIEVSLTTFLTIMQPIHLAIGVVEGVITGAIVSYLYSERPDMIVNTKENNTTKYSSRKRILVILTIAMLATGGILSLFASSNPDGLEWTLSHMAVDEDQIADEPLTKLLSDVQESTAILPDYNYKSLDNEASQGTYIGTSISGVAGGLLTLVIVGGLGFILNKLMHRKNNMG